MSQRYALLCLILVAFLFAKPGQAQDADDLEDQRLDDLYFPAEVSEKVTKVCSKAVFDKKREDMAEIVRNNIAVGAAWLRAGFHDCITATRGKKNSGCNGSLRFELDDPRNARLGLAIEKLDPFIEEDCLNWADGFMMAVEATMMATGGPTARLVRHKRPRFEATEADGVGTTGLLLPPVDDWATLVSFYAARGLDEKDLVSSSVGGHALGGFTAKDDPTGPVAPFTTTSTVDNLYAANLFDRAEGAAENRPGFNTLPSDEALIETAAGVKRIKRYAKKSGKFMKDFGRFLKRMSRLDHTNVSV